MSDELSGLELLRECAAGKRPHPPMAETIPMKMVEINEGEVRFLVRAGSPHINPLGIVHGGFAATVLDSVTGCAVHTLLDAGVPYATIDLNVKFTKQIPIDTDLWAVGKVINISKKLGIAEGEIRDNDGNLYAHATASCLVKR